MVNGNFDGKYGIVFFAKRNDLAGVFVRLFLLLGALLATFGICLGIISVTGQSSHFVACNLAFVVVLVCSTLGHVVGEFPRGDQYVVVRLSGSIAARSGLLLFFLVIGANRDLLNNGLIYYILAFYAIGLGTDVMLTCLRTANRLDSSPVLKR